MAKHRKFARDRNVAASLHIGVEMFPTVELQRVLEA
jgi:hypothetical protein